MWLQPETSSVQLWSVRETRTLFWFAFCPAINRESLQCRRVCKGRWTLCESKLRKNGLRIRDSSKPLLICTKEFRYVRFRTYKLRHRFVLLDLLYVFILLIQSCNKIHTQYKLSYKVDRFVSTSLRQQNNELIYQLTSVNLKLLCTFEHKAPGSVKTFHFFRIQIAIISVNANDIDLALNFIIIESKFNAIQYCPWNSGSKLYKQARFFRARVNT